MITPMLYILSGFPGSGKSTLSAALASRCKAFYIRIDTIEQSMRNCGLSVDGPAGYMAGYALALDNLRLGTSVVADSVNPLEITRSAWIDVAQRANVPSVEIEIICSDKNEHRRRIESRKSEIPGLELPNWEKVMDREYEPWSRKHLVVDTAGRTIDESITDLIELVSK